MFIAERLSYKPSFILDLMYLKYFKICVISQFFTFSSGIFVKYIGHILHNKKTTVCINPDDFGMQICHDYGIVQKLSKQFIEFGDETSTGRLYARFDFHQEGKKIQHKFNTQRSEKLSEIPRRGGRQRCCIGTRRYQAV